MLEGAFSSTRVDNEEASFSSLVKPSVSSSTWKDYWVKHRVFVSFAHNYTGSSGLDKLSLFIAHLYKKNLSVGTIRSYLSAISFHYKLGNHPDITKVPVIVLALKGLAKHVLRHGLTRKPIRIGLLHSLIRIIGSVRKQGLRR